MNYQQIIERYGGKAASLLAQHNAGNTDFLFPFSIIEVNRFEQGNGTYHFKNKQIVRGSATGDEKGLVDVIRTVRDVPSANLNGQIDLREAEHWTMQYINSSRIGSESNAEVAQRILKARFVHPIERIIRESMGDEVVSYARWEGLENYSGASSIIIQPENIRRSSGSIIEHPNIKEHYLVSFESIEPGYSRFDQYLTDSEGNVVVTQTVSRLSDPEIKSIVQMKKKSRKVGFIRETHSSQVEFGLLSQRQDLESNLYDFKACPSNEAIFYQEREFLPFDFSLRLSPKNYEFNRFGKLPEPQNPLRIVNMDEVNNAGIFSDQVPSIYVAGERFIHSGSGFPLWFRPENMVGYIVPFDLNTQGGNTLLHNNYRWVQKAHFSLLKRPISGLMEENSFKHGTLVQLTDSMLLE